MERVPYIAATAKLTLGLSGEQNASRHSRDSRNACQQAWVELGVGEGTVADRRMIATDVTVLSSLPQAVVAGRVVWAFAKLSLGQDGRGHIVDSGHRGFGDAHDLARAADVDGTAGMLGAEEDRSGNIFRRVDRRGQLLGEPGVVLGVLMEGRADGSRLDKGDGDRRPGGDLLTAEGVGEAKDGVLGDRIHALDREGEVGCDRTEVDERAAALLEGAEGGNGAVDDAPEVDVEELAVVGIGDLVKVPPQADPGVVDPGVEAAEAGDGLCGEVVDVLVLADIGDDEDRVATLGRNVGDDLGESGFVARGEDDVGSGCGGLEGSGEPDAAGGSGDDDGLLGEGLEGLLHGGIRGRLCGKGCTDALGLWLGLGMWRRRIRAIRS